MCAKKFNRHKKSTERQAPLPLALAFLIALLLAHFLIAEMPYIINPKTTVTITSSANSPQAEPQLGNDDIYMEREYNAYGEYYIDGSPYSSFIENAPADLSQGDTILAMYYPDEPDAVYYFNHIRIFVMSALLVLSLCTYCALWYLHNRGIIK